MKIALRERTMIAIPRGARTRDALYEPRSVSSGDDKCRKWREYPDRVDPSPFGTHVRQIDSWIREFGRNQSLTRERNVPVARPIAVRDVGKLPYMGSGARTICPAHTRRVCAPCSTRDYYNVLRSPVKQGRILGLRIFSIHLRSSPIILLDKLIKQLISPYFLTRIQSSIFPLMNIFFGSCFKPK